MSLVNEMLNELQKEKSKGGNFEGLVAVKQNNSFWLRKTTTLALIVLLIIAIWLMLSNPNNQKTLTSSAQAITTKNNVIETKDNNSNSNFYLAEKLNQNNNQIPHTQTTKTEIAEVKNLSQPLVTITKQEVINANQRKTLITTSQPISKKIDVQANNSKDIPQKASNVAEKLASKKKPQKVIKSLAAANSKPNSQALKNSNKPIIKVSRKSLAEKELRSIANQWKSNSAANNQVYLDRFLQKFSDLDSAWLGAINLVKDKNFSYHQKLLTQALASFPAQPAFRMIVIKQQISEQNYAGAFLELKKIDRRHWQQSQYRIAGFLAQKINDHVSAIRFYNQLLKSKPNQGDINMAIAISLEALKENSLAVAKFQRALEDSSLKPIQRQFIAQRIAVLKG